MLPPFRDNDACSPATRLLYSIDPKSQFIHSNSGIPDFQLYYKYKSITLQDDYKGDIHPSIMREFSSSLLINRRDEVKRSSYFL